ncbi:MAG TPA: ATP-binding protein, partial [Ohtaekwangia sp.]|uniref:sensor histidine kinase n=1 Tax=Ohtaekwangia sp. TaxID=2066019 RepID=UPI002F9538D4
STLADILLTNLVNNALKHNVSGGNISIRTTSHSLTIANTGAALTTDPQRLFERFKKQNQASGSLGLGLAIVKKICDNYHLDIEYAASGTWHTLTITKK